MTKRYVTKLSNNNFLIVFQIFTVFCGLINSYQTLPAPAFYLLPAMLYPNQCQLI